MRSDEFVLLNVELLLIELFSVELLFNVELFNVEFDGGTSTQHLTVCTIKATNMNLINIILSI